MKTKVDYLYNPHDWETTYDWDNQDELFEEIDDQRLGTVHEIATLIQGPKAYAVEKVMTRDFLGEPKKIEWVLVFDKEEAEAIAAEAKK
jgi:hypothetical protein